MKVLILTVALAASASAVAAEPIIIRGTGREEVTDSASSTNNSKDSVTNSARKSVTNSMSRQSGTNSVPAGTPGITNRTAGWTVIPAVTNMPSITNAPSHHIEPNR